MDWEKLSENPLLISNYNLLKEIGLLDYLEELRVANQYRGERELQPAKRDRDS